MSSAYQIDTHYRCSKCFGDLEVYADLIEETNEITIYVLPCENCAKPKEVTK